jgi:hypothetical protein
MDPDVKNLVSDSGSLLAVTGIACPGDRFSSLRLESASGALDLRCDDDTDEIVVEVSTDSADYPSVGHAALDDLIGLSIEYAWTLIDNRGFVDAFQIRLTDGLGRDETRQFEVGASAMDVRRVVV